MCLNTFLDIILLLRYKKNYLRPREELRNDKQKLLLCGFRNEKRQKCLNVCMEFLKVRTFLIIRLLFMFLLLYIHLLYLLLLLLAWLRNFVLVYKRMRQETAKTAFKTQIACDGMYERNCLMCLCHYIHYVCSDSDSFSCI